MDTLFSNTVTETIKEQQLYIEQVVANHRLANEVAEEVKKVLEEKFAVKEDPSSSRTAV